MELPERLPGRRDHLEVAEFDSEFVVFDAATSSVHLIGGVPAVVFDACDGETTVESLIGEFAECGLGTREEAVTAILDAYISLIGLAVLDGVDPADGPPCLGCFGASANPDHEHLVLGRRRRRIG